MQPLFDALAHAVSTSTTTRQQESILLDGREYPVDTRRFAPIPHAARETTITFVDGGQAELLKAPNVALHFVRVAACTFHGTKRGGSQRHEFYVLTRAAGSEVAYETQLFPVRGEALLNALRFNSMDATIRTGTERAEIGRIASLARRFAELELARQSAKDAQVVVDGTLEARVTGEQARLDALPPAVAALAKTVALFTAQGNAAAAVVHELGIPQPWSYPIATLNGRTVALVKLHAASDYVFRFEARGESELLPALAAQSGDPVFLGYPYGLIWADRMARVSNQEAAMLKTQFFTKLGADAKRIRKYLNAANAHEVLDSIG